ncbi:MAG: endonuclease NucS [Nitrospinota bacterium]|nr:endonuclease NucS [Nitrospinota bacterium]MDP7504480.1 endonuclease NucS [Nitrospinota bacterium]MDP7663336.1 endonuclease NucS [Nitrospinota bacterium]
MQQIGLWQISDNGPKRLGSGDVSLEKHLEDWIENDPSLLLGGLKIIGRQIYVEAGPLDLLALDHQGRWVLIEIKKGMVRRETVAQAIDYASCIEEMPFTELSDKVSDNLKKSGETKNLEEILKERIGTNDPPDEEREVEIYVVGTG